MLSNQVFRVMVVEDEILILNHLISKIKVLPFSFEVSMSASNGKDALALIQESPPDIIFTDVKMPVMSGIQLVEQIHHQYPEILTVIISGYEEFEYVSKAIHFGVVDYLLKPVNTEKLYDIAQRLYSTLQSRKQNESKQTISRALSGQLSDSESTADKDLSVCLIKFGNLCEPHCEDKNQKALNQFWNSLNLETWLLDYYHSANGWWLMSAKDPSCQILIVSEPLKLPQNDLFAFLTQTCGNDQNAFAVNLCEYPSSIAILELRATVQSLYDTICLQLIPYISGYYFAQPGSGQQYSIPDPFVYETLRLLLKPSQYTCLSEYLKKLLYSWKAGRIPQCHLIKYVHTLFHFFAQHNVCSFTADQILVQFQEMLAVCQSADQLYAQLFLLLEEHVLSPLQESHSSAEIYQKIKEYIELNYPSSITMESLSEIFHISPSYLSRIFRKYSKKSPIKYLIEIRMSKAGKIIAAYPDMDFKTIAELVGYSDQHYFSRYFKQFFNMTPTEYKLSITNYTVP